MTTVQEQQSVFRRIGTNKATMTHLTLRGFGAALIALVFTMAAAPQTRAQDRIETPDVVVAVDGLACPFCAYGLEKKLKKLDGVEALVVDMDAGKVRMKLKEGATLSEARIREAVSDAGFTVAEISFPDKEGSSVEGT
jgi:periplasmic mercuric ion binding protein